jgi:hypothetical protein
MRGLHPYSRMGASGFACSVVDGRLVRSARREGKHVTDTTLGSNDTRRTWVVFELAPEPKDQQVDAEIEHVFVSSCRLQEMLASERSLWGNEERSQKCVLAFRPADLDQEVVSSDRGRRLSAEHADLGQSPDLR